MHLKTRCQKTILSHSPQALPGFCPFPYVVKSSIAGILFAAFAPAYAQAPIPASASVVGSMPNPVSNQTPNPVASTVKPDIKATPVELSTVLKAENIHGVPDIYADLDDLVEVIRGNMVFKADKAHYQQVEDQLDATANVSLQRDQDCYRGDVMRIILESGIGYVLNPSYFLAKNKAQGKAERIDFASEERSTINNGTYSTCPGLSPDWYLQADTISLDTGLDRGVASGATLYFKGVPLPILPWFKLSFPLSDARQSGVLPPTWGHTPKGGNEIAIPYYFNIAPNRDLTLQPKLIEKRGLQLGIDGRYLGENYSGETNLEFMHDSVAARDKLNPSIRYEISSVHMQKIMPQLIFSWNVNKASDNNYPTDFSNSSAKTAQRLLPQEVGLDYYGSFWNASLRTSSYQVLQDISSPIGVPYERLPQLSLHAGQYDVGGIDWSVDSQLTDFYHPTAVRGQRALINGQVSLPYIQPGYFVVPKLSYYASSYQLENTPVGQARSMQRTLPSMSLDAGMVFERQAKWFDKNMTQTLEPRLFYVNIPYRDQKNFPLFDTAQADFNYAQIFSENRFTGYDRIGDANQITAGLSSRFIEDDGRERVKLSFGQRFYFNTQKVTLDGKVNPSRSDFLMAATGQVSDTFNLDAALQVSQSDRKVLRSSYAAHWQPEAKKILNLQWQFQRDVLKQLELSGQWPLAQRWYVVGKANYSLLDHSMVESLAGFEYHADCWAFRLIAHRFATTILNNNSGFAFQLEFNGLGKLGRSNPLETMKKAITGYQSVK
ncbi:MAG: LPS-assembly protein LptD [Undibacterium sp.]|nr:LPS-assembly protein LptD [Undibacterium sp.]